MAAETAPRNAARKEVKHRQEALGRLNRFKERIRTYIEQLAICQAIGGAMPFVSREGRKGAEIASNLLKIVAVVA
jgi:hypothetical protein